ncbi:MAG: hypothetical protein ACOYBY_17695 [Dermatophilaceae bacterium]
MDNFLCTNDMSLHTIGHTSEGPLATLSWDTRPVTPEATILSRASRPAPQTRSVEGAEAARQLLEGCGYFEKDGPLDPTRSR